MARSRLPVATGSWKCEDKGGQLTVTLQRLHHELRQSPHEILWKIMEFVGKIFEEYNKTFMNSTNTI